MDFNLGYDPDWYTDTSGFLTETELDDILMSGQAGQNNLSTGSVMEVTALGIASAFNIPIYSSETPPDEPFQSRINSFADLQRHEAQWAQYERELERYNAKVAAERAAFTSAHSAPWLRKGAELRYKDKNGVDRPNFVATDNNLLMRHNNEWYIMPTSTWDQIGRNQLIDNADINEDQLLNWDKMLEDSGNIEDLYGENRAIHATYKVPDEFADGIFQRFDRGDFVPTSRNQYFPMDPASPYSNQDLRSETHEVETWISKDQKNLQNWLKNNNQDWMLDFDNKLPYTLHEQSFDLLNADGTSGGGTLNIKTDPTTGSVEATHNGTSIDSATVDDLWKRDQAGEAVNLRAEEAAREAYQATQAAKAEEKYQKDLQEVYKTIDEVHEHLIPQAGKAFRDWREEELSKWESYRLQDRISLHSELETLQNRWTQRTEDIYAMQEDVGDWLDREIKKGKSVTDAEIFERIGTHKVTNIDTGEKDSLSNYNLKGTGKRDWSEMYGDMWDMAMGKEVTIDDRLQGVVDDLGGLAYAYEASRIHLYMQNKQSVAEQEWRQSLNPLTVPTTPDQRPKVTVGGGVDSSHKQQNVKTELPVPDELPPSNEEKKDMAREKIILERTGGREGNTGTGVIPAFPTTPTSPTDTTTPVDPNEGEGGVSLLSDREKLIREELGKRGYSEEDITKELNRSDLITNRDKGREGKPGWIPEPPGVVGVGTGGGTTGTTTGSGTTDTPIDNDLTNTGETGNTDNTGITGTVLTGGTGETTTDDGEDTNKGGEVLDNGENGDNGDPEDLDQGGEILDNGENGDNGDWDTNLVITNEGDGLDQPDLIGGGAPMGAGWGSPLEYVDFRKYLSKSNKNYTSAGKGRGYSSLLS